MFEIFYTREARDRLQEIAKFDPKSARIILNNIEKLPDLFRHDPFLKGNQFKDLRRHRAGKFRVIYRALEEERQIRIITIDYRRSVYD